MGCSLSQMIRQLISTLSGLLLMPLLLSDWTPPSFAYLFFWIAPPDQMNRESMRSCLILLLFLLLHLPGFKLFCCFLCYMLGLIFPYGSFQSGLQNGIHGVFLKVMSARSSKMMLRSRSTYLTTDHLRFQKNSSRRWRHWVPNPMQRTKHPARSNQRSSKAQQPRVAEWTAISYELSFWSCELCCCFLKFWTVCRNNRCLHSSMKTFEPA